MKNWIFFEWKSPLLYLQQCIYRYFLPFCVRPFLVACCIYVGLGGSEVRAQAPESDEPRPQGYFLTDSVKIGSPVVYSLSYRHTPGTIVIFPDSGYDFAPFELVDKKFFPTRTDRAGSLDSVLYTLMTFEIDKVQQLSLPVYVISEKDSTPVYAAADSVYLRELITGPVDTLHLKSNTRYVPVERSTNYLTIALVLVGLLVLFGLVVLVFGKQIRKRFRLYRLQRRHEAFLQYFGRLNGHSDGREEVAQLEGMLVSWKQYIESVGDKPYSTYTTKEITDNIPEKSLGEALRHIDRTIYGGMPFDQGSGSFQTLRNFAIRLYEQRRHQIVNS